MFHPGLFPLGHPDVAKSLDLLASVLAAQGSHAKALEFREEAIQTMRASKDPVPLDAGPQAASRLRARSDTADFLRRRAALLAQMLPEQPPVTHLRQAEQAIALAAALHDRLRGQVLHRDADQLQQGEKADPLLATRIGLLARLFEAEHKPQDLRTAFEAFEAGRARVFLESLGEAYASRLTGLPDDLAAKERTLAARLREIDARTQYLSLVTSAAATRELRLLYADRLKVEDEQAAFLAKLRQSHPQYAGFRHPQPCTIEQARSCLRDNELALLFAIGQDSGSVLLLEKAPRPGDPNEGIRIFRLPGAATINPAVGTLLSAQTLLRPARARELAGDLYRRLLGPLGDRLAGKDLVIVPDGALALLPFELLVEGQTDDDEGSWLVEKHRVRYAPSLTALYLAREAFALRTHQPTQLLWALADPIFDPQDARLSKQPPAAPRDPTLAAVGEGMQRLRGGKFTRLVYSGREVDAICRELGVPADQVVRGAGASEAAVKAASTDGRLAQARYIHFATHGVVGERSAYEQALVLNQVGNDGGEALGGVNDGFLRVPEVTFLELNADVVVLSACETARGRRSRGEGVSGLARAFLYAGSRGVVCSLWSVDDARTAELMAAFYRNLKEGKETGEALRQARLVLLRQGQAPFFWAPFILMGE